MNPFGADTRSEIQKITKRVLDTFTHEYLKAFKYVAIRDAKKARKKRDESIDSSQEEPKQMVSTPEDPHRPRGKNKYHREINPELQAKIVTWTKLDSDVDPYVAYIVEASLGERSSSVYRRYNEFKELTKKIAKKFQTQKNSSPLPKLLKEGNLMIIIYKNGERNSKNFWILSLLKKIYTTTRSSSSGLVYRNPKIPEWLKYLI